MIILLSKTWAIFCHCFVQQHGRLIEEYKKLLLGSTHVIDIHIFLKNKTKCLHKKCSVPRGLLWSPNMATIASWRSWSPIETTNTGIHPVEVYVFGGKSGYCITIYFSGAIFDLPPIVKRLDTPIDQINHQPLGKSYQDLLSYLVDSDLCCSIYPLNYWRREFRPIDGKMVVNRELSKDVVDNSKNVIWKTWRFCSHFSIIQSHYACFRNKTTKLNICHPHVAHATANRSFHVVERTRMSARCANNWKIRVQSVQNYCFFHYQICKFVKFMLPSSSWLLKLHNRLFSNSC